jgi:hypothetical protein
MSIPSDHKKHYHSARARFLKPACESFFEREFPRLFGPITREKIADELVTLFEAMAPERSYLTPGQMLWNALDKQTRGDSSNRRLVPVILTVITEEDVTRLSNGTPMSEIAQHAVARMIREAFEQGGILSSRDIGLLRLHHPTWASHTRRQYEHNHNITLPHTGALHDMGTTVSHKAIILRKIIVEKKDPSATARECYHTQRAVDHYLKDYYRVRTLYRLGHDMDFIHHATQIAKHVINEYLEIIDDEPLTT